MPALASYDRATSGSSLTMRRPTATAAQVLQALKQLDAAFANYDRAIQLEPHHAQAYYNRGNALRELKRLMPRLRAMTVRSSSSLTSGEAYSNRGSALQELKQLDAAVASLDRADPAQA